MTESKLKGGLKGAQKDAQTIARLQKQLRECKSLVHAQTGQITSMQIRIDSMRSDKWHDERKREGELIAFGLITCAVLLVGFVVGVYVS